MTARQGQQGTGSIPGAQPGVLDEPGLSDDLFRLAMDNAAISMCLVNPKGRFLRVNHAMCRFLDRSEQALLGLTWPEITHPEDLDKDRGLVASLLAGEQDSFRTTKRYIRPDTSVVWGDVSVACLRDPDRSVRVFVVQILDISAMVAAREELADSRSQYRLLAENASDVVSRSDRQGVVEWVSPSVTQTLGWEPEDLIGRRSFDLAHPDDLPVALGKGDQLNAGQPIHNRVRMRCADGSYRWMSVSARPLRDDAGVVAGRVVGWRDATSEVAAESELAAATEHYRLLAENGSDVVVKTDQESRIQWISPSAQDVLGWDPAAMPGRSFDEMLHPGDLHAARTVRARASTAGRDTAKVEVRVTTATGHLRWMSDATTTLLDDEGTPVGRIHALRDIQEEHDTRERLQFLASHDPLTSLATRNVALNRLQGVLTHAPRTGGRVAVLFIDIDGLKQINDSYGHATGDQVITEIAVRIATHVRADDLVARFGGDEFVAILTAIDSDEAAATVAEKIRDAVAVPVVVADHRLQVSVSIGVNLADAGSDPQAVLQRADAALYRAKQAGRDTTVVDDSRPGPTSASR